jgi:cell division protein FtsL
VRAAIEHVSRMLAVVSVMFGVSMLSLAYQSWQTRTKLHEVQNRIERIEKGAK